VDPPGHHAGDRRSLAHDPDSRPHGRDAQPDLTGEPRPRQRDGPRGHAGGAGPADRRAGEEGTAHSRVVAEAASLETPIGEDSELGDFLEDKSAGSPNESLLNQDLTTQVERALSTLSPKEKEILRLRFGIGEEGEHTLEEVGQRFAVTRERIRQIEAKALRKLRHPLRGRNLRAFVEN